jgi:hypothetical protein
LAYLVRGRSGGTGIEQRSIKLNVAHVEQLVVLQARRPTGRDVRLDVVEVSESPAQGNVLSVVKGGSTSDENTIL